MFEQKIYVKRFNKNIELPKIIGKGDFIDLRCSETIKFKAPQAGTLKHHSADGVDEKYRNVTFDIKNIKLGVGMLLPKGIYAELVNRGSTGKGMGISLINGEGVIDGGDLGYNGPNDEWRFPAIAWRDTTINEGERFCQFSLKVSQKATIWQKLRWLFSNGVKVVEVDDLPAKEDRGGGCVRVE